MTGVGAASSSHQGQIQSQLGMNVLKETLNAQQSAETSLMNGFDKVESTISSASKEPGKGQYVDMRA